MPTKMKKIMLMLARGGSSQADIAAILHVSKRDVSAAAKAISDNKLSTVQIMAMDDRAIDDTFFPKEPRARDTSYLQPDLESLIERKRKNPKIPLKMFWGEHCEQAANEGKRSYSYQAFCEMFSAEAIRRDVARHFKHAPGEKAFIDWAGLTGKLTDRITGKTTKVYVLVITLPCSSRFWAGGYTDMKKSSWLDGHMAAFEEFGGTPRMLVPDNCSTATDRTFSRETVVNADYERFAEHYGAAVVPARVRHPRDKSLAEKTVDLVERWVIAPSSELTFYTLEEFNQYCTSKVRWLNERAFSDKDGSRLSAFEELEADHLMPLPAERFELCEWRRCKVPPDYHIRIDYMHYSVPYTLISKTLDVRTTQTKVTVYAEGVPVAEHGRLFGRKGQYSTCEEHMPPNHRNAHSPWSRERFSSWAEKIGPETKIAVERLMNTKPIVEQSFVACRNILELAKSYSPQMLEQACVKCNALRSIPSYTGLKNMILAAKANQAHFKTHVVPEVIDNAKSAGHTRGADAYRRKGVDNAN